MQPLSPKSITSTGKNVNKSIEMVTSQTYLPHMSGKSYSGYAVHQRTPNFNYALQTYLQGKNNAFYGKMSPLKYLKNKRGVLADTQEKIFAEIIGLIGEIEDIKAHIVSQLEQIKQIQIQNPDVEEKMRYHGYSQPLTIQQCNDLEEENVELFRKIEEIENRKESTLELALASEKAQYQQLKLQLSQSAPSLQETRIIEAKISELKSMIAELEKERFVKIRINYPGIDRLKTENEDLRQKRIGSLKIYQLETQEQQELSEYLERDEQNRMQFMQELRKFKGQYKRLKEQNHNIKERLARRDHSNSKQNSSFRINTSKLDLDKSSLQVESVLGQKKDRLKEYQSFIRLMQQNVRG